MQSMLQYQNIDMELDKLQRSKNSLEEVKVIEKMKNVVKTAQNNSIKIENDAEGLLKEYNALKSGYDKHYKTIQQMTKEDINTMSRDQINNYLMKINAISSELFMIERNLNIVITKISTALKEFENNKKTAVLARNKHKEAKDSYTNKIEAIEPKIAKLAGELKKLEGSLDPAIFNKYKTMKNDGIFPVFAKLQNDACGYCRMEIPKSKLDNLKGDSTITCEHCRRIIFR
ncbi:MAG: hypothetical protein E7361_01425 [Clostridiales bacterium]|nr:hypothetical protein [Clostridiales bacterium]